MQVNELIDRTLSEWLYPGGDEDPMFDFLADDIAGDDNVIPLEGRAERVPRDSTLQIGSEVMLVSDQNGTAITAAKRGANGTEATNHSAGALVQVDPIFTRIEILHALRGLVAKIYPWGVYRRTVDTTKTYTRHRVIEMGEGVKKVHSILVRKSSSEELYTRLSMRGQDWIEYHEFDPVKIQIRKAAGAEDAPMRVVCIGDFTLPEEEGDSLEDCGIPETLQEDLPMAVAGMVLQGREVPRAIVDRIREQLAAEGQQAVTIINVGGTLVNNFRRDAVTAERRRQSEQDDTAFEWQRR